MNTDDPGGMRAVLADYAAAGAEKRGFWRVVVALLMLAVLTFATAILVILAVALWSSAFGGTGGLADLEDPSWLIEGGGPVSVAFNLATIALLWPALWLILRVLHRQRLGTLFSPEARIRWREFAIGAALITTALVGASLLASPASELPTRSVVPLGTWVLMLLPFAVLIFCQATAEELVFRGYLLQQLALRSRNPLIWAGVPSLLFGMLHFNPELQATDQALYVVATFVYGLLASATVARTGSLATAMGIHVATNILAVTVIAQKGVLDGAALFVQPREATTLDILLNIAVTTALLILVLSPYSPIRRRRDLSAEA